MFRIECFIDDKHLAKLKWALHELGAYNVSDHPVADSKPKSNGKRIPHDELVRLFLAWAKQNRLKEIRAPQARKFCADVGLSEGSYSHVLGALRMARAITKHGTGSSNIVWKVKP